MISNERLKTKLTDLKTLLGKWGGTPENPEYEKGYRAAASTVIERIEELLTKKPKEPCAPDIARERRATK